MGGRRRHGQARVPRNRWRAETCASRPWRSPRMRYCPVGCKLRTAVALCSLTVVRVGAIQQYRPWHL